MENRFLKRLQTGLVDLQKNPSGPEVAGIPRSSFEVFVRIFRHGLPPETQQSLPAHNLADKEYLRLLTFQVDSLLQKPAEAEKILANMPPIASLEMAYQKAHETQAAVMAQHQNWQTTFEQQIKQYNLDLTGRLDEQLQKELPSLIQNPGKRKVLVSDMAQTIQNQGLPAIKGDYQYQAQNVLQEVLEKTIKRYAAEIEELPTEEKITAVAETIAKDQADSAFTIRRGQIRAETPPAENSTYKISAAVETSVIANLPPELAEDPQLVNAVTGETMSRIHMAGGRSETEYREYVAQQTRAIITQTRVAEILEQKSLKPPEIEKIAVSLSARLAEQTTPEIYQIASSPEFGQTPFAGSRAAFAPAGGGPKISPPVAVATSSSGGLDDVYLSSGGPLHTFTALASPHGLADLGKWLITAGPIRAPIGFALDSIPGMPKIDYFHLSLFMLNSSLKNLTDQHRKLLAERSKTTPGSLENYETEKELSEVQQKLAFLRGIESGINNNPLLKKSYNFFFNKAYAFIHPFEAVKMWALGHGPIAHLGVSGVIDVFSLTAKYGGAGFAYGTTEYLKNAGILALKYGLTKLKIYKIVGVRGIGGHREFVFAPTYELKIRAQKWISEKLLANKALSKVVDLLKNLAAKFGLTLAKFLSGIGIALGILVWLYKKFEKVILAGLAWVGLMILEHGLWAGLGALGGIITGAIGGAKLGALIGTAIAGPLGGFVGGIVGFFIGGFTGLIAGTAFGVWLHGVWESFAGSLSSAIGNFSLSSAISGLGLGGYAAPVLTITATTITVGYFYASFVTQGAFFLPQQLPRTQSDHLLVQKTAAFSGKLGEEIKYTLTIGAKKEGEKLVNIKINDKTESLCKGTPPSIAERTFNDKIPSEILYGTPWQANYGIQTDNAFNDCLITNTATVTADVENGPAGEQSFYTASVTIGNPPFEYPSGWPVAAGCISQGPNGTESHSNDQAIDISGQTGEAIVGTEVFATHKGTVSLVFRNHSVFGNYLIVSGSGQSGSFQTLYAHLQTITVAKGQKITRGAKLGTVGSTGRSTGRHLHYEFRGLKMGRPYLGNGNIDVPACVGREACKICF